MRRTKIVCTIGPSSESPEMIQKLLAAGMNVARLNFSHGSHEEHGNRIRILRQEAEKAGKNLGILLDTKGPEIRIRTMPKDGVTLVNGQTFLLDISEEIGSKDRVGITYSELWKEVEIGTHILLDDGLMDLEVVSIESGKITTKVINSGLLKSNKGVNVPGISINLPALTEKDIADIIFGLENNIDFIAASFTRKASDILAVRKVVEDFGSDVMIIAKIENQEGLQNIDSILDVADGIMVARGDLGVEIPVEDVPLHQKEMIRKCNLQGKPVIVATQMLDSMIRQPRPTRAEASDVANAILDGTDAIMLSGETAAGDYPIEAVQMMVKIAHATEVAFLESHYQTHPGLNITDAISFASCAIAEDLAASSILTPTHSGFTAQMVSKYRPKSLIIAATPFPSVARKLSLQWGVETFIIPEAPETDQLLSIAINRALEEKLVKTGEVVVITAGVPSGKVGATNMIKVQIIGNVIAKGIGIGKESYSGTARIVKVPGSDYFDDGDILVTSMTDLDFISLIARAGAVVVQEGGLTSHAAITALEYGIPAIVGAREILKEVKDGSTITVDSTAGVIYDGIVAML